MLKDMLISHRVLQRERKKNREWPDQRGENKRRWALCNLGPRITHRSWLGPLPSLRGERPPCWTMASLVGYLLRHMVQTETRDAPREKDDSVFVCGHKCECISFTPADELLAEHPKPLCLRGLQCLAVLPCSFVNLLLFFNAS